MLFLGYVLHYFLHHNICVNCVSQLINLRCMLFYFILFYFQITNKELLHAVVGLYDVSLGEMTPDTLYATVCERWARTIILLRDVNGKKLWVFVSVLIRCTQYAKYILFYTVGPRNKVHPRLSFFPKKLSQMSKLYDFRCCSRH